MGPMTREIVSLASPGSGRSGAGGWPCQGLYHRPAASWPTTAFIAAHYEVDFAEHYLADELAGRGYGFLGWNTRFRGAGTWFSLEPALADIGAGVSWLAQVAGVERVVLLGNSGGASLMAAYQAEALAGRPGLVPGNLFVSLNAHRGRPDVLTAWLDPSVTDESDPLSRDASVDMFDPGRGLPYDDGFVHRYRQAQQARNERITAWARAELGRLEVGGVADRVFAVFRTWADLRFADLTIDPSRRQPGCYRGDAAKANAGTLGLAATCTCRSWLAMWSLADSQCRAEPHLTRITQPALVVQSDADQGCFPSDARAIHAALGSTDRTLVFVAGDHYLLDPPGARSQVADLVAGWLQDHGASPCP